MLAICCKATLCFASW